MALPQYRLSANHFFAPNLIKSGTIINYDGSPTRDMEPLNDEAEARLEEYFAKNPQAAHHIVDDLANTVGDPNAEVEIEALPDPKAEEVLSIAEAQLTRPAPGPTEKGGKVVAPTKKD